MIGMARRSRWPLLVGVMLLTGCGDLVTTQRHAPGYSGYSIMQFLNYAAAESPVLVRVANSPFGGPALDGVVANFASDAISKPVSFTADPAMAKRPDWQLVVVFNPSSGVHVSEACENAAAIPIVQARLGTEAVASFCNGAKMIAGVRAYGGTVTSASDPEIPPFGGARRARSVHNDRYRRSRRRLHAQYPSYPPVAAG